MAYFEGDAVTALKNIKSNDGRLDYSTLPEYMRKSKLDEKTGTVEHCRDITATLTMLCVAVRQLAERLEKLEKKQCE